MVYNNASPFDSLASAYDAWFEEEGKLVFSIEAQAFREVLKLLPRPCLEIGVGSGRFAEALGIDIGLDPSIELLNMARNRGVDSFLSRGEETPFADGVFGTVFLIVTLCFVDSPPEVLGEANRLLQKDGKAILGLVLQKSPWGQFYQLKKVEGHRFYKFATFYNYQEIEALLEQSDFVIEKVLSTLFQRPGEVEHMEFPQEGFFSDAGFTVILARKSTQWNSEV
ncbi:MAG: class I SAM-dependent methyltransferase [Chloroflexota bacterium]|nr:class I SAM-dependent methyltransferase [Chloroflexota bacterium]